MNFVADLAVLFPGQGAQSVGMLSAARQRFPVVGETFSEASEVLGFNAWAMVSDAPEGVLGQTENTQPLLLTASVALWRVFTSLTTARPAFLAGHSLGEYSALVCARALTFSDGVALVRRRGQLMQQAATQGSGAMAAILGLAAEKLQAVCAEARALGVVEAANLNAPGQIVISGEAAAVTRAMELARQAGARRSVALAVSVPSHCSLMRDAAAELQGELEQIPIRSPDIPVVNNVDAVIETAPERIREALVRQLFSPVRWSDDVSFLAEQGVTRLGECGPGRVLAGLVRRIDRSLRCTSLEDPDALEHFAGEG